jgi:exonuclease VII small subunit
MGGPFGIEQLKKIVVSVAHVVNVVDKLLNKGGLGALLGLIGPVNELKSLNLAQAKQEILDLSDDEQKLVKDSFKNELNLSNPLVQSKVLGMVDCLDQSIDLVEKALALVNEGKEIVNKAKNLLSQP